jgi:hypothetical protein
MHPLHLKVDSWSDACRYSNIKDAFYWKDKKTRKIMYQYHIFGVGTPYVTDQPPQKVILEHQHRYGHQAPDRPLLTVRYRPLYLSLVLDMDMPAILAEFKLRQIKPYPRFQLDYNEYNIYDGRP